MSWQLESLATLARYPARAWVAVGSFQISTESWSGSLNMTPRTDPAYNSGNPGVRFM